VRILHIEGGKHLYGGAYQVLQLVRLLRDRCTNILACPKGSAIEAEATKANVIVVPIPLNGEGSFPAYFALRDAISDLKPDIVHVHSRRGADLWGVLAASRSHTPLVITRRVDNPEPRWLARFRYKPAARVVGISEKICEVLHSEGVPCEKLVSIRSGVDTDVFQPHAGKAYLTEQFGIGANEKVVVMAAQFIRRKGHATLLEAVPAILAGHADVRFLLLGQGSLLEEIRMLAKPFGERVLCPGFRDDFEKILPECDIIAHPAEMEGLGVVLLQAAACGIPAVATRAGGIPEVVRDGRNGFLIDVNDARLLALRVNSLLDDETLRVSMSRYAREFAVNELSVRIMADANFAMYNEILNEK
jgi:glycosyltransferase involved in cell wall biosynthesis